MIIRQGEIGNTFHVIESGRARVSAEQQRQADAREGDRRQHGHTLPQLLRQRRASLVGPELEEGGCLALPRTLVS
ncbi:MAG: hypothetical protein R6X31_08360 [Anaerolineae bacterium]